MAPSALDLPGPSRRIRVEPLRRPAPEPSPEPDREAPAPAPAEEPSRPAEPVPA